MAGVIFQNEHLNASVSFQYSVNFQTSDNKYVSISHYWTSFKPSILDNRTVCRTSSSLQFRPRASDVLIFTKSSTCMQSSSVLLLCWHLYNSRPTPRPSTNMPCRSQPFEAVKYFVQCEYSHICTRLSWYTSTCCKWIYGTKQTKKYLWATTITFSDFW